MNELKIYRQGDILFVKVSNIPQETIKTGSKVIIEYEATGHKHLIASNCTELYELEKDSHIQRRFGRNIIGFVNVLDDTLITHDEHQPIKLPKGKYQIIRQREFNPEGEHYAINKKYMERYQIFKEVG